jgi:hypothetical protein
VQIDDELNLITACLLTAYAVVRRIRPLLRRALITRRPVGVSILARNPEVRFFLRTLPRRVRFVITVTYLFSYKGCHFFTGF